MNIPVMLLIIVCSFSFIVLMAALIRRKKRARYTVSCNGQLLYNGKPVNLDEFEIKISE